VVENTEGWFAGWDTITRAGSKHEVIRIVSADGAKSSMLLLSSGAKRGPGAAELSKLQLGDAVRASFIKTDTTTKVANTVSKHSLQAPLPADFIRFNGTKLVKEIDGRRWLGLEVDIGPMKQVIPLPAKDGKPAQQCEADGPDPTGDPEILKKFEAFKTGDYVDIACTAQAFALLVTDIKPRLTTESGEFVRFVKQGELNIVMIRGARKQVRGFRVPTEKAELVSAVAAMPADGKVKFTWRRQGGIDWIEVAEPTK